MSRVRIASQIHQIVPLGREHGNWHDSAARRRWTWTTHLNAKGVRSRENGARLLKQVDARSTRWTKFANDPASFSTFAPAKNTTTPVCGAAGVVDIEMAGGSERSLPRRCGLLSKLLIRARPMVGSPASKTSTGGTDSGSVSQHPLERR
jgi:hypothetical protein